MELWIPITVIAALSQTIRTAIQRQMKRPIGDQGAAAIRFLYAVPFAWSGLLFVSYFYQYSFADVATINTEFAIWVTVGGIAQILFTIFLIKLFSYKNFLIGIAFSKTEVIIAAAIEALINSKLMSFQFGLAIFVGTISVVLLSIRGNFFSYRDLASSLKTESTYIGLISGLSLAISVIAFRSAINSLPEADFLIRATTTAAIGVTGQSVIMLIYLRLFHPSQLNAALRLWRPGLATGIFAAITTASWFSAFALHSAAPVRAVGQIELIFSMAITILIFRQRLSRIEILGTSLLLCSILLVIFD
jgi:drug/metabolite transporter (DMT)-like permease